MITTRTTTRPTARRRFQRLLAATTVAAGLLAGSPIASATTTPNAPQDLRVINGRYRLIAVWNAPVANAATVSGYRVTATDGGSNTHSCTTSHLNTTRCAITGLVPGVSYQVSVVTRSASGNSVPTAPVSVNAWFQPQAPQGGTNFSGSNLGNLDLSWVNLSGADLTNANFNGSNMRGANIKNATVTGATFGNAELAEVRSGGVTGSFATARQYYQMVGGYLIGPSVNLWNENLSGLNLTNANLWGAQLSGANFSGANLTNANLSFGLTQSTNFSNANMGRVNLAATVMTGANLSGTSLSNARLGSQMRSGGVTGTPALPSGFVWRNGHVVGPDVNLWRANLAGANLSGLNLTSSRFFEANLAGANLNGANVTGADLRATLAGSSASNLVGNPQRLPNGHYMSGRNLMIP